MRKKSLALSLMLVFSCILGGNLMGQTTIQIGSGTAATNLLPTNVAKKYSYTQQIYNSSSFTDGSGKISSISFYVKTNSATRDLDVYMVNTSKSSFSNNSDWISVSDSDKVYSNEVTFTQGGWATITLPNSFSYTGNNLAIIINDKTGTAADALQFYQTNGYNQSIYIFNDDDSYDPSSSIGTGARGSIVNQIKIAITYDYPRPSGLTVTDITTNTATVSWTAPTPSAGNTLTGYQYAIKSSGAYPYTPSATTNPINLSGLEAGTNYSVRIRAVYTDSNSTTHYSNYIETTFTTECNPIYNLDEAVWDFEITSDLPDCWKKKASYTSGNYTYPCIRTSAGHNNAKCIWFYSTYDEILLMPAIEGGLNGNTLKFFAKAGANSGTFTITIGYYNSQNVFTAIENVFDITNEYNTEAFEVDFSGLPSDVDQVAIKGYARSGYNLYLDDVSIVATDACTPVSSPTVGTVTYNSAQLSWTAGGSETNWKLQYRASGAGSWTTVEVSSANLVAGIYTLYGLSENTTYEWKVAAWCDTSDDDNISTYVAGEDFSTPMQYPMPTGLAADNITANSADITWTAGSTETAWQLYYTPYDYATPGSASPGDYINISTTHAYTMTGLTGNTTYYVYVRADYGEDHYSSWTDAMSFKTSVLLPYSYDFEDGSEMNYWTISNGNSTTGRNNSNGYNSSEYSFRFMYGSSYTTQYLISPELNNTTLGVHVEFFAYRSSNSNSGQSTLNVSYSTEGNNTFLWDDDDAFIPTYNSYILYKFDFPAGTKYIAIKYAASTYDHIYIDNISFRNSDNKFTTTGNWSTAANWSYGTLPTASDDVIINAACTIPNACIAEANNITLGPSGSLTIADGGQLILPKTSTGVQATVKKETYAATAKDAKTYYYWYAISSAVANPSISSATNLITETVAPYHYDLYRYNEAATTTNAQGQILYWENYRASHADFTTLEPGRGYLYRNTEDLSIEMTGEINVADFNYSVTNSDGVLAGFNLIGNPYSHDIYKGAGTAIPNGTDFLRTGFYYMDPTTGKWTAGTDNSTAIKPNQGLLVQTDKSGNIEMTNTNSNGSSKSNNDNIMFKVANSQYSDETYAWFDKGRGLNKISHRNAEVPMLYINQDGENYAIATMSDDIKTFSLNFKAMTMGKYTLSYKTKGEFNYLHVIDRLTGEDVDMLLEGEYSFVASPNDSDARFIVRLEYTSNNGTNDSSVFAYQSGNEIIVSGEGELQIFDVMGRKISTHQINGVETVNVNAHGVYIFKLNEKTQKIIIK